MWLSLNCMIYAFCIAAHVCGESTAHWWIPLQAMNSAELCCLIDVLMSCWTNCGDSSEKTRETPMWRDSIAGGTPHKRSAWCFLSCLPERTAKQTVELPVGWNPMTRMRCHCYVSIRHSTWLKIGIITSQSYLKYNRAYQIQKAQIPPAR